MQNFSIYVLAVPIGVATEGSAPPIEMLPMTKMSQKRLLFFLFQFLLATSHITVHAYDST